MITRFAKVPEVDVGVLLSTAAESDGSANIILVDDNNAILSEIVSVLGEVMPNATATGFNRPKMVIEYAKVNRIDLAFLDIDISECIGFITS